MAITLPLAREQRIAHLSLHGWLPVKHGENHWLSFRGVYNRDIDLGFAVRLGMVTAIIRLDSQDDREDYMEFTEWNAISDETLDRIEGRLAEC